MMISEQESEPAILISMNSSDTTLSLCRIHYPHRVIMISIAPLLLLISTLSAGALGAPSTK
jgi:hypothetical protein